MRLELFGLHFSEMTTNSPGDGKMARHENLATCVNPEELGFQPSKTAGSGGSWRELGLRFRFLFPVEMLSSLLSLTRLLG